VKRIPTTGYRAGMKARGDSNTQDEQHIHRAPTACNWQECKHEEALTG